jgi:hypothetical protein
MSEAVSGNDEQRNSSDNSKHLVLLVHGINTRALWIDAVQPALEACGFSVAPISYGEFSLVRFLSFPYLRRTALKRVLAGIETAIRVYVDNVGSHPELVSIISHSFGTWLILAVLSSKPNLKFWRLIVCGSVIREDYDLDPILHQLKTPILNEIGTNDYWPAIAESIGWGYGSIGSTGMHHAAVRNRWHKGFRHSHFLTAEFCQKFWIPFLQTSEIRRGDTAQQLPRWIRLVACLPLRWFVLGFVMVCILYGAELVALQLGGIDVFKTGLCYFA